MSTADNSDEGVAVATVFVSILVRGVGCGCCVVFLGRSIATSVVSKGGESSISWSKSCSSDCRELFEERRGSDVVGWKVACGGARSFSSSSDSDSEGDGGAGGGWK